MKRSPKALISYDVIVKTTAEWSGTVDATSLPTPSN